MQAENAAKLLILRVASLI